MVLAKGLSQWGAIPTYCDGFARCVTIILVPHNMQGGRYSHNNMPHVLNDDRMVILARILADPRLNHAAKKLITGMILPTASGNATAQIHGTFRLPHESPLAEFIACDAQPPHPLAGASLLLSPPLALRSPPRGRC